MIHARGAIPGRAQVPLHVGIASKHVALTVECEIVRIAQAADHQLDKAAAHIGANHRAGRCLEPRRVSPRIFVPRLNQVAFVVIMVRTGRINRLVNRRMISHDHVDQSVGTQPNGVRAVLAHLPLEFDNRLDLVDAAVTVIVRQTV